MKVKTAIPRGGLFLLLAALLAYCSDSPTSPPPTCTYQVAAGTTTVGAGGGTVSITITTGAGCAWTAQTNASWLTITSGGSGTGSGTVTVAASANAETTARQASISIAQQAVTLTQQGRDLTCDYAISVDKSQFSADGGSGHVQVTAPDGCRWTATADAGWITMSPAEGVGNGMVTFTVAEWNGATERSTTIRVGGHTATIRQELDVTDCSYTVTPVDFTFCWYGPGGTVNVQTAQGCPWTATAGESWITLPETNTTGAGTLTFTVGQHLSSATRRAPVMVRWPTASAGQNVWVNQYGCSYAISEQTRTFTRDAATASLSVIVFPGNPSCSGPMGPGCPWTYSTDVSWIQLSGNGSGAGDDAIFYTVAANPGPGARVGHITAAGLTLTITQVY